MLDIDYGKPRVVQYVVDVCDKLRNANVGEARSLGLRDFRGRCEWLC